ncbi:MAG: hypothetical protein ACRC38_05035, partial [Plesiomonas sp.]
CVTLTGYLPVNKPIPLTGVLAFLLFPYPFIFNLLSLISYLLSLISYFAAYKHLVSYSYFLHFLCDTTRQCGGFFNQFYA